MEYSDKKLKFYPINYFKISIVFIDLISFDKIILLERIFLNNKSFILTKYIYTNIYNHHTFNNKKK